MNESIEEEICIALCVWYKVKRERLMRQMDEQVINGKGCLPRDRLQGSSHLHRL
jgi:hypothetical protein